MKDIEIPLGKRTPKYRFFEMLPALLSYSLVLLPIVLSIVNPFLAAIFIVTYIIYWFVRAIAMAYRTLSGYNILGVAQRVDWRRRLDDLEDPQAAIDTYHAHPHRQEWQFKRHYRNLQHIAAASGDYPKPSQVYHAVIIPFVKEGLDVIVPTMEKVIGSHFDTKRLIVVLAYEERAGEPAKQVAEALLKRFGHRVFHMVAVGHPENLPNEITGKGGNINFAGRHLQAWLTKVHIDPEMVIVTTLDCDNHPHPSYFASVAYEYIVDPQRHYRSYQPIALYLNNIWDAPAPMRVLATGNSFWTIISSTRPHLLRNFSSHSQSMAALIDTNFWSARTVVEDGHQYWRSYLRFNGNYEVTPIYVPIFQDAVLAETYRKTIKEQFVQLRRWAYGASDVAYVATKAFSNKNKIPFLPKFSRFMRLLESHVSWAAAPIIITFGAWLPLFVNPQASRSIVAHELPQVASQLQNIAIFGLFLTVFLAFKLLPPRPARYKRHRNLFMIAQWALMPVTTICYGSAAAFTSQTRLLLGKYMERFEQTVKVVVKK